jgi:hypothetical protein
VSVFIDLVLVISFTGDVTQGGTMTNFDCVALPYLGAGNSGCGEIIVSDDDSRQYAGVMSLTPNALGTTNNWTNNSPVSNLVTGNWGSALTDNNPTSSNTNGQSQEYNLYDPVVSGYQVAAIKQAIRAALSVSGASVSKIRMGVNSGGTVAAGTGAAKTIASGGAIACYEQLDLINPVTGNPFTFAELAALQVDYQAQT